MMTKWDTIQADVADAYIGIEENLAWEETFKDELENGFYADEDELTLDWNE
jgi:hypothetical protein